MQERDRDPRSGATDGMAKRDRTTVHIQFLAIEMQLAITGENLGSEGFVELD